jgi:hypothetical protein
MALNKLVALSGSWDRQESERRKLLKQAAAAAAEAAAAAAEGEGGEGAGGDGGGGGEEGERPGGSAVSSTAQHSTAQHSTVVQLSSLLMAPIKRDVPYHLWVGSCMHTADTVCPSLFPAYSRHSLCPPPHTHTHSPPLLTTD